jgi:hypothetical protein
MRSTIILSCLAACCFLAYACNKPAQYGSPGEGSIYMPQAPLNMSATGLTIADTPQVVVFGAAYGGLKYPSSNITVQFAVDTMAVAAFNAEYGTNYISFPSTSYTIATLTATIEAGQVTSNPLTITFNTANLQQGTSYLLPVYISKTSAGILKTTLDTAYFTASF